MRLLAFLVRVAALAAAFAVLGCGGREEAAYPKNWWFAAWSEGGDLRNVHLLLVDCRGETDLARYLIAPDLEYRRGTEVGAEPGAAGLKRWLGECQFRTVVLPEEVTATARDTMCGLGPKASLLDNQAREQGDLFTYWKGVIEWQFAPRAADLVAGSATLGQFSRKAPSDGSAVMRLMHSGVSPILDELDNHGSSCAPQDAERQMLRLVLDVQELATQPTSRALLLRAGCALGQWAWLDRARSAESAEVRAAAVACELADPRRSVSVGDLCARLTRETAEAVRWQFVKGISHLHQRGEEMDFDCLSSALVLDVTMSNAQLATMLGRAGRQEGLAWFTYALTSGQMETPRFVSVLAARFVEFPGRAYWSGEKQKRIVIDTWLDLLQEPRLFFWDADAGLFRLR